MIVKPPAVAGSWQHRYLYHTRRRCHHAHGVDNAASPDWQTPLNGIISPSGEADQCKNKLEGTQKYINEQCR